MGGDGDFHLDDGGGLFQVEEEIRDLWNILLLHSMSLLWSSSKLKYMNIFL